MEKLSALFPLIVSLFLIFITGPLIIRLRAWIGGNGTLITKLLVVSAGIIVFKLNRQIVSQWLIELALSVLT
jgi:hypothetical protein